MSRTPASPGTRSARRARRNGLLAVSLMILVATPVAWALPDLQDTQCWTTGGRSTHYDDDQQSYSHDRTCEVIGHGEGGQLCLLYQHDEYYYSYERSAFNEGPPGCVGSGSESSEGICMTSQM